MDTPQSSGSITYTSITIIRFSQVNLQHTQGSSFLQKNQVPFNMAIGNLCGTHARVFSQPIANGNSKNEIRQKNRKKVNKYMQLSTVGTKKVSQLLKS